MWRLIMRLQTSEDIIMFIKDGHLVIDQFIKHEQKSVKEYVVPLLLFLSKERTLEELQNYLFENNLDSNKYTFVLKQLIDNGIVDLNALEQKKTPFDSWGKPVKYFHFNSRTVIEDNFKNVLDEFSELSQEKNNMPCIYKHIDAKKEISLPDPTYISSTFSNTALNRQTIRSFDINESISLSDLSTILYYTFGATATSLDHGAGEALFKVSPSGGGRHSIEAYPVIFNVDGVENGIYHYSVKNHSLELVEIGDFRDWMISASGNQYHTSWPAVSIIYVAQLERVEWKYKSARGYKSVYMDLGHLSQTMYLTAASLNMGCFYAGAMKEEMVEEKLNLDMAIEMPIGVSGIGKLRQDVELNGRYVRDDITYLEDQKERIINDGN